MGHLVGQKDKERMPGHVGRTERGRLGAPGALGTEGLDQRGVTFVSTAAGPRKHVRKQGWAVVKGRVLSRMSVGLS